MHKHQGFNIKAFFDEVTSTLTYLVFDPDSKDAVVVDSVLDYDASSGGYFYESAKKVLSFISEYNLKVHYILETHAHADHLSASVFLKQKLSGARVGIGKNIKLVREVFSKTFNMNLIPDGSQFDELFEDGETIEAGSLKFKVIFTPGHTPACTSLLIGDALFSGDALFMPDYGTGRCDFPKGCAEDLYDSITQKLYTLSDETRVYTGHDYQPNGRKLEYCSTIGQQKRENIRLKSDTTKEDFIMFRRQRDAKLSTPRLLIPSIQVNIDAGHLPKSEDNGVSYIKIPLSELK